jgi:hypothetical protein
LEIKDPVLKKAGQHIGESIPGITMINKSPAGGKDRIVQTPTRQRDMPQQQP